MNYKKYLLNCKKMFDGTEKREKRINIRKEKKWKKFRDCFGVFADVITVAAIVFAFWQYLEYKNDKEKQLTNILNTAKFALEKGDQDNAFIFFQEYKQYKPNDTVGYNRFFQGAIKRDSIKNKVQWLERANSLSPDPYNNEAYKMLDSLKNHNK